MLLKKSKYGAKKITRDGITFDSLKEYRRFCELSLLEKSGDITELKRQATFPLIPTQREEPCEVYKRGKNKGMPKPGKVLEKEDRSLRRSGHNVNGAVAVEINAAGSCQR